MSWAGEATLDAKVTETLIDADHFGVCMVRVSESIAEATGLNCAGDWVTFSCSGDFQPKEQAYRVFDSAQLSMMLDQTVEIHLDDERKHNGYCLGTQITVSERS